MQENDGLWSLPGGWVNVNASVKESAVREEAGLDAAAELVIAVQDREKHDRPVYARKICKVFILCSVIGGHFTENIETVGSGWLSLDELPPLSEDKNTREQIEMCFDAFHSEHWVTGLMRKRAPDGTAVRGGGLWKSLAAYPALRR